MGRIAPSISTGLTTNLCCLHQTQARIGQNGDSRIGVMDQLKGPKEARSGYIVSHG